MKFQSITPGLEILLSTPYDQRDVGPLGMHPEFAELKMPQSGFPVTFRSYRLDGQNVWIYDTDDDKRINRPEQKQLKEHYEAKLLKEIEQGDPNFKLYEPPKTITVDREEYAKLKRIAKEKA